MGVLVDYINRNYLKQNRNCVAVLSGATGTGKSWSALSLGAGLDKTFNYKSLENRICFSQEKFIKSLNERDEKGEFVLKKGMVLMYEEGGVSVDSRSWWMNKDLSHIFETFRNRNLIILFTMPLMKMLDSNVRALTNFSVHTEKIHRRRGVVKAIVKELLINKNIKASDSYITRYIQVRNQKYKQIFIPKPPIKLRNRYEKIANQWKWDLIVKKENMIEERKNPKKKELFDIDSYVKKVIDNPKFYNPKGKLESANYISTQYPELSDNKSRQVKALAKKRLEEKGLWHKI